MKNIITATMNRAANHGAIVKYSLIQQGAFSFPYGDNPGMIEAAKREGITVTQNDGDRFVLNNSVWMTNYGVIYALNTSNL